MELLALLRRDFDRNEVFFKGEIWNNVVLRVRFFSPSSVCLFRFFMAEMYNFVCYLFHNTISYVNDIQTGIECCVKA